MHNVNEGRVTARETQKVGNQIALHAAVIKNICALRTNLIKQSVLDAQ